VRLGGGQLAADRETVDQLRAAERALAESERSLKVRISFAGRFQG